MGALLVLGLGALGLLMFKSAHAAPPPEYPEQYEPYVPTDTEILSATSEQLDTYYELINELLVTQVITPVEYQALYDAYSYRFNELYGAG